MKEKKKRNEDDHSPHTIKRKKRNMCGGSFFNFFSFSFLWSSRLPQVIKKRIQLVKSEKEKRSCHYCWRVLFFFKANRWHRWSLLPFSLLLTADIIFLFYFISSCGSSSFPFDKQKKRKEDCWSANRWMNKKYKEDYARAERKRRLSLRNYSLQNNFSHNNYLSKIIIKCGKLLRE